MPQEQISLPNPEKSTVRYYPQLDTLRIIAALGIINLHWLAENYLSLYGIDKSYDWGFGKYGVQLFFVLSGFLITDILIRRKGIEPTGNTILNFSIRRVLRLFPIY
jgi:peptidoglycan/LPS O-acetylase OafA/YrhL